MANHEKLLEGLKGAGIDVSVSGLARHMSSNGIMVSPSVGRRRGYVSLDEKAYGVDLNAMSEGGRNFYRGRVSQGHLNFIPPKDEAAFGALEKRLRRAVEKRTLADGFMPMAAYDSLKEEFEKIRDDYFVKRDEVLDKWPLLVAEFRTGAQAMLDGIVMPDYQREQVLKAFMDEIPSVGEYRESFSMTLQVRAFPAECNKDGLNSSVAAAVQETWKDDVMTTAITAIESLIGMMWAKCLTAIQQYVKKGSINSKTIDSLARLIDELSWKNVFMNPVLTQLYNDMRGMRQMSEETQAEAIEIAVATIYKYAINAHVDLDFANSPYSKAELQQMVKLYVNKEDVKNA